MTIDLTDPLNRAIGARNACSEALAVELQLFLRSRFPRLIPQWDRDAGEDWGRLLQGDRIAALVRIDCPLLLVQTDLRKQLDDDRCLENVVVCEFEDPADAKYRADPATIVALGGEGAIGAAFSPQSFSIDDLWWATL
jgi:hypothetical protein